MSDLFRFRCERGHVVDAPVGTTTCKQCGAPLITENCGVLQVYRMGSPFGMNSKMGIYIDRVPYGYLGHKKSVRIVVPYGTHNLHMALLMNRRCNDLQFTITPEQNYFYAKAQMRAGAWSNKVEIMPSTAGEMPQV